MATKELPGGPEDPEFIGEAFRQMEEDELSEGMVVPVTPASRSSLAPRTPLQGSRGMRSRNEVMRRRVENVDGSAGR
eukprot:3181342-Pyramimonas_sp.AAC.1